MLHAQRERADRRWRMRQDSGYSEVVSVVPPQLTRGGATLYAAADRVYALDAASGALRRTYEIRGAPHVTAANDMLYISVTAPKQSRVQAVRTGDGGEIWSF